MERLLIIARIGKEEKVMGSLGRHILAEIYGCDAAILNDCKLIEKIMVEAALKAGAEILEVAFHKFSPQGVSGVVVISESHLSIHTWPELNYAAADIFTCGDKVDPWNACNYLKSEFKARNMNANEFKRGSIEECSRTAIL